MNRILLAGATGYLGKFAVQAFKQQGYYVRVLTRSKERLFEPGPFTAPALTADDVDELTQTARQVLRTRFANADAGVSGVNFAVAETGTLCIRINRCTVGILTGRIGIGITAFASLGLLGYTAVL